MKTILSESLQDPHFRTRFAAATLKSSVEELVQRAFADSALNQTQLADLIGVSRARTSQIFCGDDQNFTLDLLGRIAGALGLEWRVGLADMDSGSLMYGLQYSPLRVGINTGVDWAAGEQAKETACAVPAPGRVTPMDLSRLTAASAVSERFIVPASDKLSAGEAA